MSQDLLEYIHFEVIDVACAMLPASSSFQSSSVLGGTFGFEMPGKRFRAALVYSIQNSNILLTGT